MSFLMFLFVCLQAAWTFFWSEWAGPITPSITHCSLTESLPLLSYSKLLVSQYKFDENRSTCFGFIYVQIVHRFMFVSLGCDDLVSVVFELAKSLSRLQMSDEEMALFSATVLLSPGDFTLFELNRLVCTFLNERLHTWLQLQIHTHI